MFQSQLPFSFEVLSFLQMIHSLMDKTFPIVATLNNWLKSFLYTNLHWSIDYWLHFRSNCSPLQSGSLTPPKLPTDKHSIHKCTLSNSHLILYLIGLGGGDAIKHCRERECLMMYMQPKIDFFYSHYSKLYISSAVCVYMSVCMLTHYIYIYIKKGFTKWIF